MGAARTGGILYISRRTRSVTSSVTTTPRSPTAAASRRRHEQHSGCGPTCHVRL